MRNHKRGSPRYNVLTHRTLASLQMCLFIGYFCLLIITTNAIIKANVMIVVPSSE